jgi:hypothetical protein
MDADGKRNRCVGLLFACLALMATAADAQNYRGEAVPVIQRVDPVEFLRLRFLTFAFGREGPMEAPLSTPPVAGREYLVDYSLSISDTETVATIPTFFPQRTFFQSFKAGGAFDCGPVPNIRF